LLYSVLILKVASELVTGGLESAIGEPQDYNKNLDNNRFPDNIDIRVPERMSSGSHIEDKLDHINLSERKETLKPNALTLDDSDHYMPIKALNQFVTDWRIKARVVKKPPLREYKNAKGPGKIMNIDVIDREGTMIQATMFNETADKWFDKIHENKIYIIANGRV